MKTMLARREFVEKEATMLSRREFVKKAAYAGVGLSIAGTIIEPLTAFAGTTHEPDGPEGMDAFFESIFRMVLENPDTYMKASQLVKLADLSMRYGNMCEGAVLMVEAEKTARCSGDSLSCASIFNEMAKAYYNAGRNEVAGYAAREAFAILSGEIKNKYAGREIVSNARMLGKIGKMEKALWLLDEWYKYNSENRIMVRDLAMAYIELGQHEKANAIAYYIPGTPDTLQKIRGMADIAEGLADAGRKDMAREIVSTAMIYRNRNPRKQAVAEDISIVYAKVGELDKAFDIAEEAGYENSFFRIATYTAKTGNIKMAKKAAYPALTALKTEDERYLFMLSFPEVAGLFVSLGDLELADRTLKRAINYMERADIGEYFRVRELTAAGSVYANMERKGDARNLLRKALENVVTEKGLAYKADEALLIGRAYIDNGISIRDEEIGLMEKVIASCKAA